MKLHVLTFGICLVQLWPGSFSEMDRSAQCILNETRMINGASEQFIEDLRIILEKYHNNSYVNLILHTFIHVFAQLPKDENSRINVSAIIERSKTLPEYKMIDNIKILQSIFSKELPPERFNGLLNLIYATRPSATAKEIENALNYFHGDDTIVPLVYIPDITLKDCPSDIAGVPAADLNPKTLEKLKSLIGLKPTVLQDFNRIFDKFPCHEGVAIYLHLLSDELTTQLHGNIAKISACTIKKSDLARDWKSTEQRTLQRVLNVAETILSTRLKYEDFRGIIHFMQAFRPDTPIEEIEKALKYLYDEVPKAKCSA